MNSSNINDFFKLEEKNQQNGKYFNILKSNFKLALTLLHIEIYYYQDILSILKFSFLISSIISGSITLILMSMTLYIDLFFITFSPKKYVFRLPEDFPFKSILEINESHTKINQCVIIYDEKVRFTFKNLYDSDIKESMTDILSYVSLITYLAYIYMISTKKVKAKGWFLINHLATLPEK